MVYLEQEEKIVITLSKDEALDLYSDLSKIDPTEVSDKIVKYLGDHLTV